jgi:hypothetical protein
MKYFYVMTLYQLYHYEDDDSNNVEMTLLAYSPSFVEKN